MIKRPWHIWTAFVVSLLIVVTAMAWLTRQVFDLDHAETWARAQIELEYEIQAVLWQMDVELLAPLVAQEAARPFTDYRSSEFPVPPQGTGVESTSKSSTAPLLAQPSPYIRVHFQWNADGSVQSPQAPDRKTIDSTNQHGSDRDKLPRSHRHLDRLTETTSYESLLGRLAKATTGATRARADESLADAESGKKRVFANSVDFKDDLRGGLRSPPAEKLPSNRKSKWSRRQQRFDARQIVETSRGVRNDLVQSYALREFEQQRKDQIQGVWLDWPRLREDLLKIAAVDLPGADVIPVKRDDEPNPARILAAIPAQLNVPPALGTNHLALTPTRIALLVAWLCLLVSTGAVALLLQAVLILSERRAAFVSAVTHELRTPLTTFRLYAEMLAGGVITGEQKRNQYYQTLHLEADRLSHLVENVLAYAKLERGRRPARHADISAESMIRGVKPLLERRATQAHMSLEVNISCEASRSLVRTDPTAVEQILFNLVDNACKYADAASDRRIHLDVVRQRDRLMLRVYDHGPGISNDEANRLFVPFSKTADTAANSAPGVGLGLALSRRLARDLGGSLALEPSSDSGACFQLSLRIVNYDETFSS